MVSHPTFSKSIRSRHEIFWTKIMLKLHPVLFLLRQWYTEIPLCLRVHGKGHSSGFSYQKSRNRSDTEIETQPIGIWRSVCT